MPRHTTFGSLGYSRKSLDSHRLWGPSAPEGVGSGGFLLSLVNNVCQDYLWACQLSRPNRRFAIQGKTQIYQFQRPLAYSEPCSAGEVVEQRDDSASYASGDLEDTYTHGGKWCRQMAAHRYVIANAQPSSIGKKISSGNVDTRIFCLYGASLGGQTISFAPHNRTVRTSIRRQAA